MTSFSCLRAASYCIPTVWPYLIQGSRTSSVINIAPYIADLEIALCREESENKKVPLRSDIDAAWNDYEKKIAPYHKFSLLGNILNIAITVAIVASFIFLNPSSTILKIFMIYAGGRLALRNICDLRVRVVIDMGFIKVGPEEHAVKLMNLITIFRYLKEQKLEN